MPHYSYEHTFAAGGSEDNQEQLEMPCFWGMLTNVIISFRFGTDRKCHVHIDDGLHQIFPTNPEANYAFDGIAILIEDKYELLPDTRKIYLRGWNTGQFPHTVAVAFEIKPPERYTVTEVALLKLVNIIERLFFFRKSSKG